MHVLPVRGPIALLLLAALAPAQVDRHELGLRLRAFERALATAAPGEPRRAALRELEGAVQAFFRFDLRTVAAAIDKADAALADRTPDAAEAFARSAQLAFAARLVDAAQPALAFELTTAYPPGVDAPPDLVLAIGAAGKPPLATLPLGELPHRGELPLAGLERGDLPIAWALAQGQRTLCTRTQGLSLVADRDGRLARLAAAGDAARELPEAERTPESATLAMLARLLQGMTRRRAEETVLPGARLLSDAERLAAALSAKQPFFGRTTTGQHWLALPLGRTTATLRLQSPEVPAGETRALVLALHGAGGSENLFFDGYGDGLVARLAAARGWFVAAPRGGMGSPPLPELVDALAARWPIDPARVLVVGHSMGAMQAVAATTATPQRFRAVAALGGGGAIARRADLARLPFFVGAGERDFGRAGGQALRRQLQLAGAPCTWREYADVEHLSIVQFALPDVFAFFDEALAAKR
jgi:predicted esterase